MQHCGVWVGTALMSPNTKTAKHGDVNYVGGFSGALMASPSDSSAEEVNKGDLEAARLLGVRIAEFAAKA